MKEMSFKYVIDRMNCSDVKRGQNLEAEAEARATRPRPRSRPKIIMI